MKPLVSWRSKNKQQTPYLFPSSTHTYFTAGDQSNAPGISFSSRRVSSLTMISSKDSQAEELDKWRAHSYCQSAVFLPVHLLWNRNILHRQHWSMALRSIHPQRLYSLYHMERLTGVNHFGVRILPTLTALGSP